jgi:hypothetical protein
VLLFSHKVQLHLRNLGKKKVGKSFGHHRKTFRAQIDQIPEPPNGKLFHIQNSQMMLPLPQGQHMLRQNRNAQSTHNALADSFAAAYLHANVEL